MVLPFRAGQQVKRKVLIAAELGRSSSDDSRSALHPQSNAKQLRLPDILLLFALSLHFLLSQLLRPGGGGGLEVLDAGNEA